MMKSRIIVFIAIFQSVLLLGHVFLYETWTYFWQAPVSAGVSPLQLILGILSVSFLATSLLSFRYNNFVLRLLYTLAAIWLGTLSFLFFAACACWVIYGVAHLVGASVHGGFLVRGALG